MYYMGTWSLRAGFYRTLYGLQKVYKGFLVLGVAFRVCAPVMEALTSVRVRAGIEDCMGHIHLMGSTTVGKSQA